MKPENKDLESLLKKLFALVNFLEIEIKEIELLIIASIETLKRQNKKCGKDEVFALVKDSLEEAITMESFEKSLALLQASHSIKCNIISNRTCVSIPKHSSIPKVCTQILVA